MFLDSAIYAFASCLDNESHSLVNALFATILRLGTWSSYGNRSSVVSLLKSFSQSDEDCPVGYELA